MPLRPAVSDMKEQQRTAVELPLEGCPGGKLLVKVMLSSFKTAGGTPDADQGVGAGAGLADPLSDAIQQIDMVCNSTAVVQCIIRLSLRSLRSLVSASAHACALRPCAEGPRGRVSRHCSEREEPQGPRPQRKYASLLSPAPIH
jgi:hypothetical protein